MADLVVELPYGDIAPLLEHLEGATFVNLHPGADVSGTLGPGLTHRPVPMIG